MTNRADELERFKTQISLPAYLGSLGYRTDQKSSSRNSLTMRHDNGDKLVIARGSDGHWIYFSVHDPADNGTIIDIAQRGGLTLGQVRQNLRPCLTEDFRNDPASLASVQDLEPINRNLGVVRAAWEGMDVLPFGQHPYLNERRGIPPALLALPFLEDRIRCDARGNAVFPHFTREGLSGFEVKNQGFTGFAKHGQKGLWGTRPRSDDCRLVIAETAIDALSYACLHGAERLRMVSTAGAMNPQQPALLASAIAKLPAGEVIIASDNDEGGDRLAEQLGSIYEEASRKEVVIREHRPPARGQDWNAYLLEPSR